jgi:hypothetical protein
LVGVGACEIISVLPLSLAHGPRILVRTGIPDSVQFFVITVKVTGILSNTVIRKMRHSSKVCLQMAESDVSGSIVVHIQVSEATTIMQRLDRVVPWTGDLEPQRLVNADVLGSIRPVR